MPSTISYARMGAIISKKDRESNLTNAIYSKLIKCVSGLNNRVPTPDDIAKMLYDSSSYMIVQYNLDLSTYCECVIKAINLTQNLNNKLSIISKLAELIDTSTQPLHNMLKKGGST